MAETTMWRQSGSSSYDEAGSPLLRLTWRWSAAFAAIALSAIVTTIVVAHVARDPHPFGGASLHVAVETWAALTALILSLLAYARFRAVRTLQALTLAYAFLVLGAGNLLFDSLPRALDMRGHGTAWGVLGGRLLGALLLAAAAYAPARGLTSGRRRVVVAAAAIALGDLAAATGVYVELAGFDPRLLDRAVDAVGAPGQSTTRAFLVVTAGLYALAAVRWVGAAARSGDLLIGGLATACVLGVCACVDYVLWPSIFTSSLDVGDAFRLSFYLLLLGVATLEVRRYWRALVTLPMRDERLRLARVLHDGLAQELALIVRSVKRLDPDEPAVERISSAAGRALYESRELIRELGSDRRESVVESHQRVGADVDAGPVVDLGELAPADRPVPAVGP